MKEVSCTNNPVNPRAAFLTYPPLTLLCSEGDSFSLSDTNTAARFAAKAREAATRRKVGHNMLPLQPQLKARSLLKPSSKACIP